MGLLCSLVSTFRRKAVTHATRNLQSHDLLGEGIDCITYILLTIQVQGRPIRVRDQLNAGVTSEAARTWKTIHTRHSPIHSNKMNMKGWLLRPSDIRGPCGPNASPHLSYRWGNLSQPGFEPVPAAWQARMLVPASQRWTMK